MPRAEDVLAEGLRSLPAKDEVAKQAYSQQMSAAIANAFGEELRNRGMEEARPAPPGVVGASGAERRMAGGIGAKKVDVTWATEECGLILAASIKTINWADGRTGNYQKNLTNRRGDLLFESVTLHRRYPYAVLLGFLFLDAGAAEDDTDRRNSTFMNAHQRLRAFNGRESPEGREEQYERLYIALVDASPFAARCDFYAAGEPDQTIPLSEILDDAQRIVVVRNPDFYDVDDDGCMKKLPS